MTSKIQAGLFAMLIAATMGIVSNEPADAKHDRWDNSKHWKKHWRHDRGLHRGWYKDRGHSYNWSRSRWHDDNYDRYWRDRWRYQRPDLYHASRDWRYWF